MEGRILDGTNADRACEFFDRYADDLDLLLALNLNSFRLSLNWPALMPDRPDSDHGPVCLRQDVMATYKTMLSHMKEKGVKTFVTLFHFCLPSWLSLREGFLAEEAPEQFRRFASAVADELGDLVDYWITINEPLAYAYQGYVAGLWPPGHNFNYFGALASVRNLLLAHAYAYDAIKQKDSSAIVGFANHWRPFVPANPMSPLDQMVSGLRDSVFNQLFPRSVKEGQYQLPMVIRLDSQFQKLEGEIPGLKGTMDFLGVNYYTRDRSRFKFSFPIDPFGESVQEPSVKVNGLGWEVYPDGLFDVLTRDLAPFRFKASGEEIPVVITENGYAERHHAEKEDGDWSLNDVDRVEYLISHLSSLHRAIEHGVKVIGYLHWSLLDNFEWAEGLSPRFGLVRVAYPSQKRELRRSATVYADIAAANGFNPARILL